MSRLMPAITRRNFVGKTETFVNNDQANKYLKPAYRKHYRIPDEV